MHGTTVGKKKYKVPVDWYVSPNIIQDIKSERMRWAGHVACTGDRRGAHRVFFGGGNLMERGTLKDP
jgi:hypothetical protein